VIAVDCYCPVVSPFTGAEQGYLAVLLALGTSSQVQHAPTLHCSWIDLQTSYRETCKILPISLL